MTQVKSNPKLAALSSQFLFTTREYIMGKKFTMKQGSTGESRKVRVDDDFAPTTEQSSQHDENAGLIVCPTFSDTEKPLKVESFAQMVEVFGLPNGTHANCKSNTVSTIDIGVVTEEEPGVSNAALIDQLRQEIARLAAELVAERKLRLASAQALANKLTTSHQPTVVR